MLIKYFKGEPNKYVIRYRNGRVVDHGEALDFWYLPFNTSIAVIDTVSQDSQFIFNESTANYQEVAIQGFLTYRFEAPLEAAKYLDFSIDPASGKYRKKAGEKLSQRVVNAVQSHTRKAINTFPLDQALTSAKEIANQVLEAVADETSLKKLGVSVESLYFTAITPTPEMQKALEAEYRESLQRNADKAIYDRRAASVEEERKIQQREMDIEIEVEERRKELVGMQAENSLKLAEAEARADEMKLNPYGDLAPQALIGLALKEFAGNAGRIGSLNITPDMLSQVINWVGGQENGQAGKPARE
ncbi:MAG: SPFH domain-containing protein [Gammaproteobacteria bacterium]|jgi:regulator of protease activity HflC (stomatin/prohibitin superfamily)